MTLLDLLREQLSDNVAERLGGHIGLTPEVAKNIFQAVVPLQLDALTSHAQTQSGAQQLLDLASSVPTGNIAHVLSQPNALTDLVRLGNTFVPTLLGEAEQTIAGKVNEVAGAPTSAVRNMGRLTLPLLLSVVLQYVRSNNIAPAQLGSLLLGLRPNLQSMLPAGLAGLLGGLSIPALATTLPTDQMTGAGHIGAGQTGTGQTGTGQTGQVVDTVSTEPVVHVTENEPVRPTTAAPVGTERVVEAKKGGIPWWVWLIPLLLLALLLRGCFSQTATTANPTPTTQTDTAQTSTASDAGSVVVEKPQAGSTIPAAAFTMQGKGKAGDNLIISDQGQQVAEVTVGSDGNWSAEIPAPTAGEHTYTLQGNDTGSKAEFKVNVGDAANTGAGAATNASTAAGTSTTGDNASAAGTLSISEPKDGATTPGGAFDLKGTGTAGQVVEVFEDGTSLGSATVGSDGTWSLNVPAPAAGTHKYDVKGPETSVSSTVTVGAAQATGQACTKDFTLSLKDGDTVNDPFRFGGVGQGKSYTVTVKRGERVIGTKVLPLDASCGYSYTSNPGQPGDVTYVVSQTGGPTAATITLHVQ